MPKIKKYQWGQALSFLSKSQKDIGKFTDRFNSQITKMQPLGQPKVVAPKYRKANTQVNLGSNSTKLGEGISRIIYNKGAAGLVSKAGVDGAAEASLGGNLMGAAPEIIDSGLNLLGAKEATIQGTGDKVLEQASTALWKGAVQTGNVFAIAGAGIIKGVDYLNRYAGKTAKKQGTDAGLNTGGYALQLSQGAGQKATLFRGKDVNSINKQTRRADRSNLLAGRAAYGNTMNQLAASNTYGDISSRTQQQLTGKTRTNVLAAKKGCKINPKKLSTIKKKAQYNITKAKDGGQLNVIPEGALHARKNNYEGDLGDQVTSKGIPVITYDKEGAIIQHAEIENSEIIFNKETSTKLEDLYKQYKETDDKSKKLELELECGKFLADEILENTIDNVGLLEPKE